MSTGMPQASLRAAEREQHAGAGAQGPSKFFPRFPAIEEARAELKKLACFGSLDTQLVRR